MGPEGSRAHSSARLRFSCKDREALSNAKRDKRDKCSSGHGPSGFKRLLEPRLYLRCLSVSEDGFVRSGRVALTVAAGNFGNAGNNGNYWSSRTSPSSASLSYNLNFNASGVNPSNGPTERWRGYSLRCLIRGGCRSFKEQFQACHNR